MDLTSLIQPVSIGIEVLVCLIGIALAVQKKRVYGWFIAFTFGVYVVYDLIAFLKVQIAPEFVTLLFFAASLSMVYAVWLIYRSE